MHPRRFRHLFPITLTTLTLAVQGCSGLPGTGREFPGDRPAPAGQVILEEHPADPNVLRQRLEARRAEGAPAEEIARLEELLALTEAYAKVEGMRISANPSEAEAVRQMLHLSAEEISRQTAMALLPPPAAKPDRLEEESLALPAAPVAGSLAERIARADETGDEAALDRILLEVTDADWEGLPLSSVWSLSRALAREQRFAEAAGRLSPRVTSLGQRPGRAELWLSLGQWLLAAERYEESQEMLEHVLKEYDSTAGLVRNAEELLETLQSKAGKKEKEMLARLVEAQAIVDFGSDYTKALALAGEVRTGFPGTKLSRRASDLEKTITQRSAERLESELAALWKTFEEGAELKGILDRLQWLSERTPGEELQKRIARAVEEFRAAEVERGMGRLKARHEQVTAKWEDALAAEEEGRLDDAIELYRQLADTPRREEALGRLTGAIDKLAERQRRKAAELFERGLSEKKIENRVLAFEQVEGMLQQILEDFPTYKEKSRVQKDLALVRSELEKARAAAEAEKNPPQPPALPAPQTGENTGNGAGSPAP